jgi:short-subunit dehydrogenase
VVVTGASSGLGAGFARALASAGANLVLAARCGDRLEALAAELRAVGVVVDAVTADVSDPEDCTRVAATAYDSQGRLDVLIDNAGIGGAVGALKETPEGSARRST